MAKAQRTKVQTTKEKYIYVLDTCVLLHDPQSIFKFNEHDLYLPLAVIDDLDDQKTRPGSVGWSAREVFRLLDGFTLSELTSEGVEVNPDGGRLFVYNQEQPSSFDTPNIIKTNSDNAIINTARALQKMHKDRKIVIVTKDTGLRVRAESWDCKADNYRFDMLDEDTFLGVREAVVENQSDWDILTTNAEINVSRLSPALVESLGVIWPNEFIVFMFGDRKCPTWMKGGVLYNLDKKNTKRKQWMGISPKNLEQQFAMEILDDDSIPLVSLYGPAGTGKTFAALAVSLEKIEQGYYDKIVIIKPLIAVGGKDIGALPGDKFEKIGAWLGPMKDNIQQLISDKGIDHKSAAGSFEDMVADGIIECEAMAFIQGRSIPNTIVIVDEAQNLTPRECRMVVERCGKNSKVILLGDLSQVENPYLDARSCGLAHAIKGTKSQEMCAAVKLSKVERSPLAGIASLIFKQPEAQR